MSDVNIGQICRVNGEHKFHANKTGKLEFLAGPNNDIAVICVEETAGYKSLIAVDIESIELDRNYWLS